MASRIVHIKWTLTNSPLYIDTWSVFRNGNKIATTREPKYTDRNASGRPKYQIVANGKNNVPSPASNIADPSLSAKGRYGFSKEMSSGSRTVVVTGEVNESRAGMEINADVSSTSGEPLGTLHVEHDNSGDWVYTTDPLYGDPVTVTVGDNYVDLEPLHAEEVDRVGTGLLVDSYRNKPVPPGDGNPTTTTPPTYVQDCPSNGDACVGP